MLFGDASTVFSCTVAAAAAEVRFGVVDVGADFWVGGEASELAGVDPVKSIGFSFEPSPFKILLILARSVSPELMLALPGGKTLVTRRTFVYGRKKVFVGATDLGNAAILITTYLK